MAGMGHPLPMSVTTQVMVVSAVRRRKKGVPARSLKVCPQTVQRYRTRLRLWIRMVPSPSCPLAGQSMLGQNTVCGSMTHLLRLSCTEECHLIRSVFQVQWLDHRLAYTYRYSVPPRKGGIWYAPRALYRPGTQTHHHTGYDQPDDR